MTEFKDVGEEDLFDGDIPIGQDEFLDGNEEKEFNQALFLGAKRGHLTVLGHEIHYELLNVDKELQITEAVKQWEGTRGWQRAYKTAVAAAAIITIDGEPLYHPLTPQEERQLVQKKFDKLKGYYPIFVDKVYEEVLRVEMDNAEGLIQKLGK